MARLLRSEASVQLLADHSRYTDILKDVASTRDWCIPAAALECDLEVCG